MKYVVVIDHYGEEYESIIVYASTIEMAIIHAKEEVKRVRGYTEKDYNYNFEILSAVRI